MHGPILKLTCSEPKSLYLSGTYIVPISPV